MKLISWNVNGIRACLQKGFLDFFYETDADIFCIQGTKLQEGQVSLELPGISSIGIMQKRKDIPALPFLPKRNPCRCLTA